MKCKIPCVRIDINTNISIFQEIHNPSKSRIIKIIEVMKNIPKSKVVREKKSLVFCLVKKNIYSKY